MSLITIFIYLLFAVLLFFILNYFDKAEKENNIIHAVIPIVYEIILAGMFTNESAYEINQNLFLIVVFELIIRLYYVKNILRREDLMNPSFYLQIYGISIVGCYIANVYFISEVSSVFPTAEEMKVGIWLLIIIFLYMTAKKHIHIQYKEQVSSFADRKQEYILVQYTRFKNIYQKGMKVKNKSLYPVIYAMMIYENYKRPVFFRKLDYITYRFTGREKKMGIMQIPSSTEIDDAMSVKMAIKKLEKLETEITKKSKKQYVGQLLNLYYENEKIANDVLEIYQKIIEFDSL